MTEKMHLTAEDILKMIQERIEYHSDYIEKIYSSIKDFQNNPIKNNEQYDKVLSANVLMKSEHEKIIELLTLSNFIEAREEELNVK